MTTFEFGNPDAGTVLIQPAGDHELEGIANEYALINAGCNVDFLLTAVKVDDWNKDLSVWEAPAVFGRSE